jgi:hypothetical protein
MKNKVRLVVAGLALAALTTVGAGTAAYAHHAFAAEFDAEKPVLLKGKVDHVEWVNPHTWIHINVPNVDKAGKPKQGSTYGWAIEGGTPNTLVRTGVNKNSLKPGTEVVVRGYQSKDALCTNEWKGKTLKISTCKANGRDVTFPNGCKLFVGSSGTNAPDDGADPGEGGANANKCAAM